MTDFLSDKAAVISNVFIIAFKALYAVIIYKKSRAFGKKQQNLLTYLSFVLPIITGIICIVKNKHDIKKQLSVLGSLVVSLAVCISAATLYSYNENGYYDASGNKVFYLSDISFTDTDGNQYTFDYESSGYDKLYINGTSQYLNADLCYIDENGYLVYDEDMSITAQDEQSCADEDGTVYYPAKFTTFNKDGSVKYSFNSANFSYDRFGNAYTYSYVPFYDEHLNKYSYSFDSELQKGFYTNITTGEQFENEYCFVDENGYFVYDENHDFTKTEKDNNTYIYLDSDGEIYFWASGVHWEENGTMMDSYGNALNA